jgi:Zn-dependent M28 family amino/carboxypeptidase
MPLSETERITHERLRRHVEVLADQIGGRALKLPGSMGRAATYIEKQLETYGYAVSRQAYAVGGEMAENIEASLPGTGGLGGIVVVGAHYDTADGVPGANDNGSGVAAALELARRFAAQPQARSIRWAFFANEENPYFGTSGMGSYAYAKRCRERNEDVVAMLSLETIGYYSDEPGSQAYPAGLAALYSDRGNFLGFVTGVTSAPLLRRVVKTFRSATTLPAEGAAAPSSIPGVSWSDHWAFWQFGYPALMVTDTAFYRYPHYHTREDTPDKLDYERMARAVTGLAAVVQDLAN